MSGLTRYEQKTIINYNEGATPPASTPTVRPCAGGWRSWRRNGLGTAVCSRSHTGTRRLSITFPKRGSRLTPPAFSPMNRKQHWRRMPEHVFCGKIFKQLLAKKPTKPLGRVKIPPSPLTAENPYVHSKAEEPVTALWLYSPRMP